MKSIFATIATITQFLLHSLSKPETIVKIGGSVIGVMNAIHKVQTHPTTATVMEAATEIAVATEQLLSIQETVPPEHIYALRDAALAIINDINIHGKNSPNS